MAIKILCIGDLVGKAGRNVLAEHLPPLIRDREIDLVVCNAENAAGGSGLTPQIFEKLMNYGVDAVTLGDHCFRKGDIFPILDSSDRIVRPANLSRSAAGRGHTIVPTKSGQYLVGVTCVLGQMYMGNNDSPWAAVDDALRKMSVETKIHVVDMHAEASSEKMGMGWHCNGRASVVFGTHTHTPTADYCVLDKGTAFISDVGMTGPYDSILGRRKDRVLKFMTTAMPQKFEVALGDPRMYGLLTTVSTETGKAQDVELICIKAKTSSGSAYDSDDKSKTRWTNSRHK